MAPTSSGPGACSSPSSSSPASSLLHRAAGACAGAAAALSWRHLTADRWRCADERGSVADGVAGLVGHTPLVRIRSLSEATGCEVREAERAGIIPVRARFFRSESAKRREEREKEREREREAMASPPILHRFFFS